MSVVTSLSTSFDVKSLQVLCANSNSRDHSITRAPSNSYKFTNIVHFIALYNSLEGDDVSKFI